MLRPLAEVGQDQQAAARARPYQAKYVFVVRPNGAGLGLGVEGRRPPPGSDERQQPLEDLAGDRTRLVALTGQLPVHRRPVHPAIVIGQVRILQVGVVIQQADLVAHVDGRNAAIGHDEVVQ